MTLKWGILATGRIADTFATAARNSVQNELVAVASRSLERAEAFAERFPDSRALDSYQALLSDPEVDAVYVATPHPQHVEWTIRALQAGKHVLCEKPMGLNHSEVMAMIDTAEQCGRFLMEAFMYRCHPQTARMIELIRDGAIGEVGHIVASFGFRTEPDPESRLFANSLGGGGIMDVGCYPVSAVRLIAGSEPIEVTGNGRLGDTGIDEWAAAQLQFDEGLSAQVATGVRLNLDNAINVYGTKGRIRVANPWAGSDAEGNWRFHLLRSGKDPELVEGHAPPLYELEIDHFAQAIAAGERQSPLMTWDDSRGNAQTLDAWRSAIGLTYDQEQPATHGGPLLGKVNPGIRVRGGEIPHLDKPVSRLVMGCDNQPNMSHASVMWDHYLELGGNCFDTAHIYGAGRMESLLGHWHQQRGLREDIVVIGKGAHTPHNHPGHIAPQLDESLDRLQTDYLDVYFLHRDNLDVPIEEFIDALNEEVRRGRVRAFGGSNWTLKRIRAANDYAERSGLQGMSAVSNNFSLAHMMQPLWPGVETATAPAFRDYLSEQSIALMPWSSQARGFFTPWADTVMQQTGQENPVITSVQPTMAELARTWFSDANFKRRERAGELAASKGLEMIQIALAYVINQPFPCFPLIGPRQLSETRSSFAALDIELSPAECRWLNLED
jgi:predicted dehydrogenase/diketogulonate reductase-like aldo/keto reductase